METKQTEIKEVLKDYVSPEILVSYIEMEQGIAAGSALSSPATINGNSDVPTEWNDTTDTPVDTGWLS